MTGGYTKQRRVLKTNQKCGDTIEAIGKFLIEIGSDLRDSRVSNRASKLRINRVLTELSELSEQMDGL
jgi:hypothetical protein